MEPKGSQGGSSARPWMLRGDGILAAAAVLVFGVWLALTIPVSPALGWDESMHAELPAARVALALRAGEPGLAVDALLACDQYPPVWPAVLGGMQALGGVSEFAARVATSLAWAATLGILYVIARRAARASGRSDPRNAAIWALTIGILCPLAASFSGTLFLEVPSALATAFALWAWMRRADGIGVRRELVAGLAMTIALFTKWNYGLLLGAALGIDWLFELAAAVRAGRARDLLLRTRWLVAIPFVAAVWWFALPLPGGLDVARAHRAAFAGFLGGNLSAAPASAAERVLYAATGISSSVVLAGLLVVFAAVALGRVRTSAVRTLVLAATLLLGAPLVHPFFLDRFLVPGLVPFFALAGLGFDLAVASGRMVRVAVLITIAVVTSFTMSSERAWLADRIGLLPAEEPARGYVLNVLQDRVELGSDRRLPTGGLERTEHDALLDLVTAGVKPGERVGWIGMSSEMSPAALHLGLLARGGDSGWFLERDPAELDLAYFGADPGFDDADLLAFANRFDVILWTDPIDLRERRERAFAVRYRDRLLAIQRSDVWVLGRVPISRPLRAPLDVSLSACRRVP